MTGPFDRIAEALERIAAALEKEAEAAWSVISSIPPEGLSKEDAARFLGVDIASIEQLIRTRKLEYVQHGSQRGRVIPVEALRRFLKEYRQKPLGLPERNGK
jgi:hypothetical protein